MKELKFKKRHVALVLGLLALTLATSGYVWFARGIKTPSSSNDSSKVFIVKKGEGVWDIAKNLKSENLIKSDKIFVLYLRSKSLTRRLQAGEYRITQNLSIIDVVDILTRGKTVKRKIIIPEGWDNEKIASYLDEKGVADKEEFLAAVKNPKEKYGEYWFVKEMPEGATLEGYLYPDTYVISAKPTADEIIRKMLTNFDKKYTQELRSAAAEKDLTAYELVTFASIVEREVSKADDRKKVAGVFWNRYDIGMKFESDATIQYILRSNVKTFTYAETKTPSPYNTYLNKGLPKGPIANPGIDSIKAVLDPEDSDFLFFLSAKGVTYFSKTLEEHESKKYKYLKS